MSWGDVFAGEWPQSEGRLRALASVEAALFGLRPEQRTLGRYRLSKTLGSGAFGTVYAARDEELGRRVAVKVLRCDTPQSRQVPRLSREARALATLSHPNVVAVFDVGVHEGQPYIVTELVEGQTLDEWLRRGPRARADIIAAFVAAGRGLHAAHEAGLVHRDFKPTNVLIGADGQVRVADFGLASATSLRSGDEASGDETTLDGQPADATATGAVKGTPHFMAPEQHRGVRVTAAADQYALCIALFEALTGARAFAAQTGQELRHAKDRGEVQWHAASSLPRSVRRALRRGLAVRAADRFHSVEALLDTLSRPSHWRRWRAPVVVTMLAGALATVALHEPPQSRSLETTGLGMARSVAAVDEASRLQKQGRLSEAVSRARQAVAMAQVDGEPWRVAWASLAHGNLLVETGRLNEAATPVERAYFTAQAAGHDEIALRAASLRLFMAGTQEADEALVRLWYQHALAILQRHPDPLAHHVRLETSLGAAAEQRGDYDAAVRHYRETVRLQAEVSEEDPDSSINLGLALTAAHRLPEAVETLRRAIALGERQWGTEHPELGRAWCELGLALHASKDRPGARAAYERAAELIEQAGFDNDRYRALLHLHRGNLDLDDERYDVAAQQYRAARILLERLHGAHHPAVADAIGNLGTAYENMGDTERARGLYREALAIYEAFGARAGIDRMHENLGGLPIGHGHGHRAD